MSNELDTLMITAMEKLKEHNLQRVFNYERPDLAPTSTQLEIMKDRDHQIIHVVGGNRSGKSQLGARIVTWWFNGTHPFMDKPKEWGEGPLTIMVIGRIGEQIETELYGKKIKPYLISGTYKESRHSSGGLQRLVHKDNGNVMIFFSHHNINEAREKVQAFTTNVIWLDEMANSASFITELMTRVITTKGKMISTFTPLIRSEEVRRLVDGASGPATKYTITMLDNPILKENPEMLEAVMEMYKDVPQSELRARLYGEWYVGESAVYELINERDIAMPQGYSFMWRHVVSVDPAMSGMTGVSVWAEDPHNGVWYCIEARYFKGMLAPGDVVENVEKSVKHLNVVRRVCDPHEVWYIGEAAKHKFHYMGVYKKNERKSELIKNLQVAMAESKIKIAPGCLDLINEFRTCQWKEGVDQYRIVNATKYHLLDTAQYFVDNKPKYVPNLPPDDLAAMESRLRQSHKAKVQSREKKKAKNMRISRGGRKSWGR